VYSSDPTIGQRGAAKATREKFKLSTFSHSTVSRSFRLFENARKQAFENKFGEEAAVCGMGFKFISAAAKAKSKNEEVSQPKKRFPAAADTVARREAMRGFFPKYLYGAQRREIESVSVQFVADWHETNRRRLL